MLPSIFSLERLSPKGSYHLVGQRYEWHTCSETSYRIVDVECIGRAKNTPVKPNRRNEKKYIYIYIYIYGTVVATSCDLNAPRCTTTVPQVRLHGSRGGVFVGHRPPRDPGDPLQDKKFYIYSDGTHTHTHTLDKNGSLYDPSGTESCNMQLD